MTEIRAAHVLMAVLVLLLVVGGVLYTNGHHAASVSCPSHTAKLGCYR